MTKRFRITASEGISVSLEFNGDEVHIIAGFSTKSTTKQVPQVKEEIKVAIQEPKNTNKKNGRLYNRTPLSDEQIATICEEYKTTAIHELMKKYHVSLKRLYSILTENGIQLRKHSQRTSVSDMPSTSAYNLEAVDNIIEKREVTQLLQLHRSIMRSDEMLSAEELARDHKFPIEFLEFATSEFELFTQKFILKMYQMGYSLGAISTRVKKPETYIRQQIPANILRKQGDKTSSVFTGERLKDEEKRAIQKRYALGESINDLADCFKVSTQTVKRYALQKY